MGYLAYKTQCKSKNKSLGMWKAKVDLFFTYALWHMHTYRHLERGRGRGKRGGDMGGEKKREEKTERVR